MKNKIFIYITILIIGLIIAIPSTYKVINKHNDMLILHTMKTIKEAAKYCYYNNSCVNDTITLEELYEKTTLTKIYNPVSKEYYNDKSYCIVNEDFKFVEVKNNG